MKTKIQEKTQFNINKSYPAEPLSYKIRRMLETKEAIQAESPMIYGDEYVEAYDIRTDRWEIAQYSADKFTKQKTAKNEAKPEVQAPKTDIEE